MPSLGSNLARRSAGFLAVFAIALLSLSGHAFATPTVTFKAAFGPIAGDASPSGMLGTGASMQLEYGISGSEYSGFPPPLIGVNFFFPNGVVLDTEDFPTCSAETLEKSGSGACPQESRAGPSGSASVIIPVGGVPTRENYVVQPYFAPDGGLELHLMAAMPVSIESVINGHYINPGGLAGKGPELIAQVPLIHTLPNVPYISFERIEATVGSARAMGDETVSYVTLPRTCPESGLPVRTELTFAGLEGLAQTTVTEAYNVLCPASGGASTASPQTPVSGTGGIVTAPSNRMCLSRRDFTIHVMQSKDLIYRRISVDINGHRVAVVRGLRTSASVYLRGLPRGRYTVKIAVTTRTGQTITGTRAYHMCTAGNPSLKR